MRWVVNLSRINVREGTGGPFAAAVFETESGQLLAAGMNLVTTARCSLAHAEIVAIGLAQRAVGRYSLADGDLPVYELVSSCEPCAMCMGAIPWSGVRRLICGARDTDARSIGFDEGAKPESWVQTLAARGIEVVRDVLRSEAAAVLREYADNGGAIYNG